MKKIIIIGAGPAGLAAAYQFYINSQLSNYQITVLESGSQVGGISKTLNYKGYRFDLGGHRFYTKFPEINKLYQSLLGKNMLKRNRLSRIYYKQNYFDYPLNFTNALRNLGPITSLKIIFSWLLRQLNRYPQEESFKQLMSNRFGDELFKIFFDSYSKKVWGIPTTKLSADWADQRIQDFNLPRAVLNAITKKYSNDKTTISQFYYPKFGPGMFYEKLKTILEAKGVEVLFDHHVTHLDTFDHSIKSVTTLNQATQKKKVFFADYFISTMPFDKLILSLNPQKSLKDSIKKLSFRSFVTVNLIVRSNPFPDQWIYIHEPQVKVGRIQNFKNWSPHMADKKQNYTPISLEYFANSGDKLWKSKDTSLLTLAKKEISQLGLVSPDDIIDGFVHRVDNAYPLYTIDYQTPLHLSKEFIKGYKNLFPCGRGGLFRYNNQDHSILTGFYTAKNIIAGKNIHDVWTVNEKDDYLEKLSKLEKTYTKTLA